MLMEETEYRLEPRDASFVVTTLRCLAAIVNPDPGRERMALSQDHVNVLTYPAALVAYTRNRPHFADRLREVARVIETQLPGEAPEPGPERPWSSQPRG